MIVKLLLLFLIVLAVSAIIYYLFEFFIPALKLKYNDYNDSLATNFEMSSDTLPVQSKIHKIAVIENHAENKTKENKRLNFVGDENCNLLYSKYTSQYKDEKICIGYGDCSKVCPQSALSIKDSPSVISDLCNGCGKCIDVCPLHLISLKNRNSEQENSSLSQKSFKFWNSCYRILRNIFPVN